MLHRSANFQSQRTPALPLQLRLLIQSRLASTVSAGSSSTGDNGSSVAYPFPKHPRPTPHEIFHLRPGASQRDIKARYYELVRIHHPDSPHCRSLPANICRSQFQSITAAYDVLTGKVHRRSSAHASHSSPGQWDRSGAAHETGYAYRRSSHNYNAEWARQADTAEENADDRWKDRVLMAVGIGTLAIAITPFLSLFTNLTQSEQRHVSAAKNLAQARREAREYGELRRAQIRKRVRSSEIDREYEELVAKKE